MSGQQILCIREYNFARLVFKQVGHVQMLQNSCGKLKPKVTKPILLSFVFLLTVYCAGCSGVDMSGTVSPAGYFLPGIMQANPPLDVHSLPNPTNEFNSQVVFAK